MKFRIVLASFCAFGLIGCSTTLKPTTLNADGYFETGSKLKPQEVIVESDFKPEYKKLAYVKTDEKNTKLNEFYLQTFKNMNVFDQVLSKDEMESLVIERGLTESVSNISDKIGLNSLHKSMGDFLVVEPYAEHVQGYNFKGVLKAYDPSTGKDVLHLENSAFNWAGLDKPLFFPLFNGFLDWANQRPISTKADSEESDK